MKIQTKHLNFLCFVELKLEILYYLPGQALLSAMLAHSAHWRVVIDGEDSNRNSDYNFADGKMCESWAVGVQWYLTKDVYPTYKGRYYGGNYTNVVMDLLDTSDNDSNINGTPETITGYDIVAIQNALIGCSTWNEWKNNVKSLNTENQDEVENLFNIWYIWYNK